MASPPATGSRAASPVAAIVIYTPPWGRNGIVLVLYFPTRLMYPLHPQFSRRTTDAKALGEMAPDRGGRRLDATRRRARNAQLQPSGVIGFWKRWIASKDAAPGSARSALAVEVQSRDL